MPNAPNAMAGERKAAENHVAKMSFYMWLREKVRGNMHTVYVHGVCSVALICTGIWFGIDWAHMGEGDRKIPASYKFYLGIVSSMLIVEYFYLLCLTKDLLSRIKLILLTAATVLLMIFANMLEDDEAERYKDIALGQLPNLTTGLLSFFYVAVAVARGGAVEHDKKDEKVAELTKTVGDRDAELEGMAKTIGERDDKIVELQEHIRRLTDHLRKGGMPELPEKDD